MMNQSINLSTDVFSSEKEQPKPISKFTEFEDQQWHQSLFVYTKENQNLE